MSTSQSTSLPLARATGADRTGAAHRRPVILPDDRPWTSQDTAAVAALAALIHRYTGQTSVVIRRGVAGAVRLAVTGDQTLSQLRYAVDTTVVEPAEDGDFQAAVTDRAEHATAALTVLSGQTGLTLLAARAEFGADAADQYALHLGRVLAAAPDVKVRDVVLLDDADLHRMLVEWNDTDEEVPGGFFHEEIAAIARRTPDADAVVWPGGRLSFGELDDRSTQLAHRLRSLGVKRGDNVGTCFPRGPESLIAQIACFKLGAAAILLDPDFPADRVRFMIRNASAVLVLTMREHKHVVSGDTRVLALDAADWRTEPTTPVDVEVEADDFIHICYTSGSTGVPKAVLVRHGAARNLIHSMRTLCGITSESRGTWLAAPGYGMVEVECFSVLAAGAPVRIPEPSVVTSPEWLRDWFVTERITHTLLMKAVCERILTLDWPAETALHNIRICGERVQSWPDASLPFQVLNLYGSAEATVVAICDITELGRVLGEDGRARRTPPIGKPTPNVRTFVLGDDLKPVPPGVVGQLAVTGDSLSAGYLDQPEATAEKWIANPIDPDRHPILYLTGDLARYWPDGDIEIVGRTDNQVKVRGNRVHLGEIEAVLAGLPGVGQAAVLAKTDDKGDTRLVAYLEASPGEEPAVRGIRAALKQKLPTFMVPSAYVVGVFELSTNGKIDRNALPEPPRTRPDVDTDYQEPRDEFERALQEIWEQALDLEAVGVLDNFFDLGGDSMRAATLTARIGERFKVEKGQDELFFELFDQPSIEGMARALASMTV
ncbi:non-ribosomal peptide synthetase [Saccharothrix violaceirubra]|uniref:Arthrofactin-type cyclic lipopeptide synthetase C n=1 Tax=Saccharothrix violaceirubra TaxID=413306 RepID=A0A7W7T8R4_9PSEU|nr:non-ribosomal peptide synthetase [Saccharothrix violaceirubra]MBB4967365.1 arthrofactin-type cyclic lipopeptide synthetase C [Saccharothrix violaceirubra]